MTTKLSSDAGQSEALIAQRALEEGVRAALWENVRLGVPAVIWKDGKVVEVSPEEIRKFLESEGTE